MKDLDMTYVDTWNTRTEMLDGETYGDYLKSEHWASVKAKAQKRPNYQKCERCESRKVDLHHTSYKHIRTPQELRVIIALCREHHSEVHELAKEERISVRLASNRVRLKYQPDWTKENRV
ncbi:hypothetical protein phiPsa397_098 [Pseudomonas phage phiPsa397]|uniref:HNH endonuclease n=1 Tax=Pseudomonas phage phiPsa397 TaxID=1460367 RepID=A0A7G9V3F2_9CAUD|nr:hypothetical protein QGX16_gp127 [Pseudomonas phage phiPsa397]QNO00808.1 hypothetical protein phiPsa397_098 [Pseudomonas phage phiPsa397]